MKVSILGSCVSRDAFEMFGEEFEVSEYYARTSLISLAKSSINSAEEDLKNPSVFRKKCVYNDLNKVMYNNIEKFVGEYFIIDFIDERFDIVKINNSIATYSNELVESKYLENKEVERINRIDIDFEQWKESADIFIEKILKRYKANKIIIHKALLSDQYKDGNEIYNFDSINAKYARQINNILEKYYDYIINNIEGVNVINIEERIASKDHKWGLSACHFTDEYYLEFIEKIKEIVKSNLRYSYKNSMVLDSKINKDEDNNDMNEFNLEVFDKGLDDRFRVVSNIFVDLSKRIIDGELFVYLKLSEPLKYDASNIEEFNWSPTYDKAQNTFLLYLFSLGHVYILSKGANISNNEEMLDLAIEFVLSFEKYESTIDKKDKCVYCWYDHAVAERAENLSYLIYNAIKFKKGKNIINKLSQILKKQMEWLYDNNNYVKNHNHGVIEDKALLISSVFTKSDNSEIYIERAVTRVKEQINFGYTKDYIHFENSIGYHLGMIEFLLTLSNLLKLAQNEESVFFDKVMNGALNYVVHSYRPNKTLPYIGDSLGIEQDDINNNTLIKTYGMPQLEYVNSKGQKGEMPSQTMKWFEHSGYVFFRESWEKEKLDKSTWVSFKSGYTSSTHKHRDDLSICLFSKGYDILIDPGMYSYVPGNKIAEYMNSNVAHNTIIVDGKDYSITMGNSDKFGIIKCESYDKYDYAVGYNRINKEVEIFRHIYYLRSDTVIIRDKIIAKDEHSYSQMFHLGPKCRTNLQGNTEAIIDLIGSDYKCKIEQLNLIDDVKVYRGTEGRTLSLISTGFAKAANTESIEFVKKGKNEEFITVVSMNDISCQRLDGKLMVDDVEIIFEDTQSLVYEGLKIEQINKDTIEIENLFSGENIQYCYYILDDETKQIYLKTQYCTDIKVNVKLIPNKSYTIIYYIKGIANQILKGIGASVTMKKSGIETKIYSSEVEAISRKEKSITYYERDRYVFSLNVNSDIDYFIKWYIYKDGASFDFVGSKNEDNIEYTFKEKGEYTVYYRLRATYLQEIDFGTFKNIIID